MKVFLISKEEIVELLSQAHMAGQRDAADIDPSYSNARSAAQGILGNYVKKNKSYESIDVEYEDPIIYHSQKAIDRLKNKIIKDCAE